MTDVHELLKIKEDQIVRVRQEINALHIVAQILENDEAPGSPSHNEAEAMTSAAESNLGETLHGDEDANQFSIESAEDLSRPIPPKRGLLRDWFGRAAGE